MNDKLEAIHCRCGGEAHHISESCWNPEEEEWIPNFRHQIFCKNCGTRTKAFYTEDEAIRAWNRVMGALLPEGDPQKNDGCECLNTTERTAKVEDIQVDWGDDDYVNYRLGAMYYYGNCGNCGETVSHNQKYCHECGSRLEWK